MRPIKVGPTTPTESRQNIVLGNQWFHPKNPCALHGRGRTLHSRGPGPQNPICLRPRILRAKTIDYRPTVKLLVPYRVVTGIHWPLGKMRSQPICSLALWGGWLTDWLVALREAGLEPCFGLLFPCGGQSRLNVLFVSTPVWHTLRFCFL